MANQTATPTPPELNDLVNRLRSEYRNDPNIVHISWGMPRRGGQLKKETAIIFQVREKPANEQTLHALGTRPIPKQVDGVVTDVQARKARPSDDMLASRDEMADPLQGGWQTATYQGHDFWFSSGGRGTLGLLCTDNDNGDTMALSNWHVWADGFEKGDNILQPATPSGGQYVEGTVKVLACGPLITSFIEWDWPDPLTAGLYGGAAAAALAAALSDHRDPTRRGQDATPTAPDELTLNELVTSKVDYVDLPFPGLPFRSKVKWNYSRQTDRQQHAFAVDELLANPQFLLGKHVDSDEKAYKAGDIVHIRAAIWDYQPRPCDAYFVVAHVIPEQQPQQAYRVVLHPSNCERLFPDHGDKRACVDFAELKSGQTFARHHAFDWLKTRTVTGEPLTIVDWLQTGNQAGRGELRIPERGLICWHAPAREVVAEVVRFHSGDIVLTGYDIGGNVVAQATSTGGQGQPLTLSIKGGMIARTILTGGGNEGVLMKYCVIHADSKRLEFDLPARLVGPLNNAHVPTHEETLSQRVRTHRCCFSGRLRLPPALDPGKCHVYVFVQNVNHVPDGTPPDTAATVIGGHVVSAGVPSVSLCAGMMLADHVFDIF